MMIVCPHCKATLETDIRNVGQKATCQNCGGSFVINDTPTRVDLGFSQPAVRSGSKRKGKWHIPRMNYEKAFSHTSKVVTILLLSVIVYLMMNLNRQSQKLANDVLALTAKLRSLASDVSSIEFDVGSIKSDVGSIQLDVSRIGSEIDSMQIYGVKISR